jgi:predicted kinase
VVLRSDVERKTLFGVGETERLPPEAYTEAVNARVYGVLLDRGRRTLGAGHSAIVDAVFAKPGERDAIAAAAKAAGLRFDGLFLAAHLATRLARISARTSDASDANRKVTTAQESYDLGPLDWAQIDASGTVEETAARARAALH